MTPDQFRELCRGTCRQLGHNDHDDLFEGFGVPIDGVRLGVFQEHVDDSPAVCCWADLGELGPQVDVARVLEDLMALNLELDAGQGEVIGLERKTRHLVLRARLTGEREPLHEGYLAEQLRHYAALANDLFEKRLVGVQRPG